MKLVVKILIDFHEKRRMFMYVSKFIGVIISLKTNQETIECLMADEQEKLGFIVHTISTYIS